MTYRTVKPLGGQKDMGTVPAYRVSGKDTPLLCCGPTDPGNLVVC